MMTVNEVSKVSGVSTRALHYYDSIGLLKPTNLTASGYRLYDDTALERLQNILLFRELQFSLKEIKEIIDSPSFDRAKALDQQITLLQLKKEHIENLIDLARGIKLVGMKHMDFSAFDMKKIDEYAEQAKAAWGKSEAYREYEEKSRAWAETDITRINSEFMNLFVEFGAMLGLPPSDNTVQKQVKKLQDYITKTFYTCTPAILKGLGEMYGGGGSMSENIDKAAGKGTAEFVYKAIDVFCTSLPADSLIHSGK